MTSNDTFSVTGVELTSMRHLTPWCNDVERQVPDDAHFAESS